MRILAFHPGAHDSSAAAFDDYHLPEVVSFTTVANLRSQAVMRRIGMSHDPADDFGHPRIPPEDPTHRHVLYRIKAPSGPAPD